MSCTGGVGFGFGAAGETDAGGDATIGGPSGANDLPSPSWCAAEGRARCAGACACRRVPARWWWSTGGGRRGRFTGTLTAIDLEAKTLKARAMFGTKKFNVADNCAIVINGRTDGRLSNLKPTDKLVFSYDEINGVNVVNRIAPAGVQANPVASTTPPNGS
jgi:hypothetical protein